jgi:hypothetical protein
MHDCGVTARSRPHALPRPRWQGAIPVNGPTAADAEESRVLGWRTLELSHGEASWVLTSWGGLVWPYRTMVRAGCHVDAAHSGPVSGCTCGIYVRSSPEAFHAIRQLGPPYVGPSVFACVELSGRVDSYHATGIRGAAARIISLALWCIGCMLRAGRRDP